MSVNPTVMSIAMKDMGYLIEAAQPNMKYLPGPVFNVQGFGAKGDGVTNDTAAIAKAINSMGDYGGILFFPPGTYLANITINRGNVIIMGCGDGSIIANPSPAADCIVFDGSSTPIFHVGIRNVRISQASGVTATAGSAIRFRYTSQSFINNVKIYNYPAPPYRGITIEQGCYAILVDQVEISNCLERGFVAQDIGSDIYFTNSRSDANGSDGFYFDSCSGMYLSNVTAYFNGGAGFRIMDALTPGNSKYHFYSNCIADSSGFYNWLIEGLKQSRFVSCWAATQKPGGASFASGMYFHGTNHPNIDIEIIGALVGNNNAHGIVIDDSYDIRIIGGSFTTSGRTGDGSGINAFNVNGLKIIGVWSDGNATNGIKIQNCDNYIVENNTLTNNALGNFFEIVSGNPTKIIRGNIGHKTEANGTASIPAGSTFVDVSHGLNITPDIKNISVTPTNNLGNATKYFISNVTATSFRINVNADPGATTAEFVWHIVA